MAIALNVQLTDAQQALMVSISNDVLPEGHTVADKIAWATEVAADGLRAEVERLGVVAISNTAREQVNTDRRTFLASVGQAWPEPVEPDAD